MADRRSNRLPVVLPLLGSTVLVAFAFANLPPRTAADGPFHVARTPFDRSAASWAAPAFSLLQRVGRDVPAGASAVVRTEPPDASRESDLHRVAVALLPGRRVLPAAVYGTFVDPRAWSEADFLIVVGHRPETPPGDLVLETPEGTLWRRNR